MVPRTPTSVQSYTVLPITCPPTTSYPTKATHYLYIRQHAPKVPSPTTPRELFLVNIPIDTTTAHIRTLFNDHLGGARVEEVLFDHESKPTITSPHPTTSAAQSRKRKRGADLDLNDESLRLPSLYDRTIHHSGATAVVRLVDETTANIAMREIKRAANTGKEITWTTSKSSKKSKTGSDDRSTTETPPLGASRYARIHALRYPSASLLQANIDTYMTIFAEVESLKARELAKRRQMPDEDGFVTVVRGGRNGPARIEETKEKLERQKEKQKGKEDFYRFQMREKNKERAQGLVRSFEEDRKTVEGMRAKRGRFRPQ